MHLLFLPGQRRACRSAGTPLMEQFRAGIEASRSKWPEARYIPYFQAHANTYGAGGGTPGEVRAVYRTARHSGTEKSPPRADCLPPEVLDYLEEIARRTDLTVELGLQSAFDSTGERSTAATAMRNLPQRSPS